jgi:acetyl-CoA acetyltransferase
MRDVVIAGSYMTSFGKLVDRSMKSLVAESVDGALDDAHCPADAVESVSFGNVFGGSLQGQESCRGQVWLSDSGLAGVPTVNVENACASGSTAVHQAWLAVASEVVDVAVAVGAEKMHEKGGNGRALQAMRSVVDQDRLESITGDLGTGGSPKSLFMGIYASLARAYTDRTGATAEDFARVAVKNHESGSRNPKAQFQTTFTLDEILGAREISPPLTLPMCAPVSDGAAAIVLTTPALASAWGSEPLRLLGIAIGGGRVGETGALIPRTAERAYTMAGIKPSDVDVVECHDAASPAEMIAMEELGLCEPGEGPKYVRAGETSIGGVLPINPSGGLESKGHPLGATGIAQLVELCDQLRGRCGDRQVENPIVALAENAGGYLGPDVATAVVTVLARA